MFDTKQDPSSWETHAGFELLTDSHFSSYSRAGTPIFLYNDKAVSIKTVRVSTVEEAQALLAGTKNPLVYQVLRLVSLPALTANYEKGALLARSFMEDHGTPLSKGDVFVRYWSE